MKKKAVKWFMWRNQCFKTRRDSLRYTQQNVFLQHPANVWRLELEHFTCVTLRGGPITCPLIETHLTSAGVSSLTYRLGEGLKKEVTYATIHLYLQGLGLRYTGPLKPGSALLRLQIAGGRGSGGEMGAQVRTSDSSASRLLHTDLFLVVTSLRHPLTHSN